MLYSGCERAAEAWIPGLTGTQAHSRMVSVQYGIVTITGVASVWREVQAVLDILAPIHNQTWTSGRPENN